jgi:hypothetical protein
MMEVIERVAKDLAAAVLDIIEWAWKKVSAPQGIK